jgi:hypothetical protein
MTVETLISNAQGYTSTIVSQATAAMTAANQAVQAVGYSIPNFYPVALPSTPPTSVSLTLPTMGDVTLELPAEPTTELVFQDIPAIEAGPLPVLTAVAPTITMPTAPSALAEFHGTAPSIDTNITFPEPPSALLSPLIDAPTMTERAEPSKPQIMLSRFDAVAPVDSAVAPTDIASSFSDAYHDAAPSTITMMDGYVDAMLAKHNPRYHEQMARIETQLATYLAGGTGIKPEVEDAIYARAQAKNDAEAQRVQTAILSDSAARGFTLPTGAVFSAMNRARQDAANNNAKAANEIAIAQAEMEQKNLQFAVTTSNGLRQTMLSAALNYHQNLIGINAQALDYAKSVLSNIIEVYNTAVKAYSIKLDAYRAEAAVFETRLKSDMASVELYRIEIAALEALTKVDHAKVEVYKARIDTLTSLSNVYRAQIEAVNGRVSLEKLKLEIFQAQVQTFSTQVQGKNAEWQGYSAAIEGQTATAKIFTTQVDAFNSQINGYKAGIEAKAEVVRAAAVTNDARARQFSTTMSGYQTVVQARGEVARTKLENQRQEIVAFQAHTQATVANAQVANEYYKSTSMVGIANAELQMKAMLGEIASKKDYGKAIADLGLQSAKVYSSMAGAAMSGMNTLAAETTST